ncbi:MAG: hypothetical protein ACTS10_04065 [Kiloniellales bacterium]
MEHRVKGADRNHEISALRYNDGQIIAFLEGRFKYGDAVERHIGKEFYSKEYYYLFMTSFIREAKGCPLTVREAIAECMKLEANPGSSRIRRAIDAGLLRQEQCSDDKRKKHIFPTEELKARIRAACTAGIDESRVTMEAVQSEGPLPPKFRD